MVRLQRNRIKRRKTGSFIKVRKKLERFNSSKDSFRFFLHMIERGHHSIIQSDDFATPSNIIDKYISTFFPLRHFTVFSRE